MKEVTLEWDTTAHRGSRHMLLIEDETLTRMVSTPVHTLGELTSGERRLHYVVGFIMGILAATLTAVLAVLAY